MRHYVTWLIVTTRVHVQSGEPGMSDPLRNVVVGIERAASNSVVQCQPWLYLRLFSYGFFWLSEGVQFIERLDTGPG